MIRMKVQNKVLVVPFIRVGNEKKFIAVRDSRYGDWTFVSGRVNNEENENDQS